MKNVAFKMGTWSLFVLLTIVSLASIFSCSGSQSTTNPTTTATITSSPQPELRNFVSEAQARYRNGLSCNGADYSPSLVGMSDSDFLSLDIVDETMLTINGAYYQYRELGNSSNVTLGEYTIRFNYPTPSVTSTGGNPIPIQVMRAGQQVGEFTFYEIYTEFSSYSGFVRTEHVSPLLFLFIYYKTDCSGYDHKWLALLPEP